MLDRRRLESKVTAHTTFDDARFGAETIWNAQATISKVWRVFIGKPSVSANVTDLEALTPVSSDGQKRPVFIYRFLTAGTIDGM